MKIYIASPLTSTSTVKEMHNVNKAMDAALQLIEMGYSPFIPHLYWYVDGRNVSKNFDNPSINENLNKITYEQWLKIDLDFLLVCDAVLVLDTSPGVEREIEFARNNQIPVFYGMDELIDRVKDGMDRLISELGVKDVQE